MKRKANIDPQVSAYMRSVAQARWRDKSPTVRSREAKDRLARTVARKSQSGGDGPEGGAK